MKSTIASKVLLFAFTAGVMASLTATTAFASGTSTTEKKLDSDIAAINKTGSGNEGGTVVVQKLEKEFSVSESQITGLRDQKLGYGEISIVFALAQKLGGITDANISKIMNLRQGPPVMGWGEIARKLGLNLGSVVNSVHKVETSSHKAIARGETSLHGKEMASERGGYGRTDRMDTVDRPAVGHLR